MTDAPNVGASTALGSTRPDVARLVISLVVLVGLAILLMAATHVTSGGCGGG